MRAVLALCLVLLCALALAPDAAQAAPWAGIGALAETLSVGAPALATGLPFALMPGLSRSVLFEGDGGAGSGDGSSTTPKSLTREEVADMLKGRFGADVPEAMLTRLTDLTVRASNAEAELARVKAESKLPEGAVVLTGDEATKYAELKARDGFSDAPLAKAAETLDANQTALTEAAALKAQAAEDAAFRKAGLDPVKVRKYIPGLSARIEGEGDAAKTLAVLTAADGTTTTAPLADHLQADHAEILPVLQADASAAANAGGSTGTGGATLAAGSAAGGGKPKVPQKDDIVAEKRGTRGYSM